LSQKRILKALASLGLSQVEAEVYVHLAEKGPQKTQIIMQELNLQEPSLNNILESLMIKRLVYSTDKNFHMNHALPFDKALELLVSEHLKKAKIVEQNKDEILSKWQSLLKEPTKT
jgi:sugar-specific transcriptional regulator TrmB